jgi:hypothetical protein
VFDQLDQSPKSKSAENLSAVKYAVKPELQAQKKPRLGLV